MWRFEPNNIAYKYYIKNCYEGKQSRFLIFNLVYGIIYLVIHLGLTAVYQSTRCDVRNGTHYPEDKCRDWASSFVKKENETNKLEMDFNNFPSIITFLMGFYVNMVVVRWWNQVGTAFKLKYLSILLSLDLPAPRHRQRLSLPLRLPAREGARSRTGV